MRETRDTLVEGALTCGSSCLGCPFYRFRGPLLAEAAMFSEAFLTYWKTAAGSQTKQILLSLSGLCHFIADFTGGT